MPLKQKSILDDFVRKAFRDALLMDEQYRLAEQWDAQSLYEDTDALSDLRDEFVQAEATNDFDQMYQLCNQFNLWPDLTLAEEEKQYLARCMMKANAIAIEHIQARVRGTYRPVPDINYILIHTTSEDAPATAIKPLRRPGRPSAPWDAIKQKLLDMEKSQELPKVEYGWKKKVGETLSKWSKAQLDYDVQADTITQNQTIKAELNRIEEAG